MRPGVLFVACAVLLSSSAGCAGCGQCALGALSGPINDPSNRALRRDILSYGIKQFCPEMVKHNAPLQMQADAPAIGRFFPRTCSQQTLENGDLYVQFSGVGYAWTNVSKKVSFTMDGTVTYDPDFLMEGCTAWAYFRTRQIQGANFTTRLIEQPIANFVNQLTPLGNQFGGQLVNAQLRQGFTVIMESNQQADFGLGMIERGKRPVHPFDVHGSGKIQYENIRTDVHVNERDFVGPIVIDDANRAIFVQAQLDGTQAIDVMFMAKQEADVALDQYLQIAQASPLPMPPSFGGDVIQAGVPYNGFRKVPPGTYFVVFDNSTSAGQVAPAINLLADPAATISYAVQIGDAP